MAAKTRKSQKTRKSETANETVERWFAGQVDSQVARDEARESFEAGRDRIADYVETINGESVVTHCERFFLEDGGYVVACWDDGGNMTFGGM